MILAFLGYLPEIVSHRDDMIRMIKANRSSLIEIMLEEDRATELSNLFGLYTKIKLREIDEYIEMAKDKLNVMSFLLEYKEKSYSAEEIERYEQDKLNLI